MPVSRDKGFAKGQSAVKTYKNCPTRKIEPESRSHAHCAFHADKATRATDKPVNLRETQAGAPAFRLCREKRLEHTRQRLR